MRFRSGKVARRTAVDQGRRSQLLVRTAWRGRAAAVPAGSPGVVVVVVVGVPAGGGADPVLAHVAAVDDGTDAEDSYRCCAARTMSGHTVVVFADFGREGLIPQPSIAPDPLGTS
jgi:hypothetical protein